MKIITTITEAKALEFGEQYVIQPKGLDYQKPETFFAVAGEIEKLQKAVEESITEKTSSKTAPDKVKTKSRKKAK